MKVTVNDEKSNGVPIFRCNSVKEAEAFIAGMHYKDAADVETGRYWVSAPEEMLT